MYQRHICINHHVVWTWTVGIEKYPHLLSVLLVFLTFQLPHKLALALVHELRNETIQGRNCKQKKTKSNG